MTIACISSIAADAKDDGVKAIMTASFRAKGQATLARLEQDRTQKLCSVAANSPVPPAVSKEVLAINLATIRYPADGQYLGDWKKGEEIAQSGVGKQFSDDPLKPSGGNCYACHQLTKQEIAYGNLGPSLYNYGKTRGTSEAIKKYTWGKVFNSDAFSACSTMPRFGHMGILTEAQMKDVVALLLDPQSPVNQ
jgi:sulfur-oxidizing protein SoxX